MKILLLLLSKYKLFGLIRLCVKSLNGFLGDLCSIARVLTPEESEVIMKIALWQES